jgi:hypothetical protein
MFQSYFPMSNVYPLHVLYFMQATSCACCVVCTSKVNLGHGTPFKTVFHPTLHSHIMVSYTHCAYFARLLFCALLIVCTAHTLHHLCFNLYFMNLHGTYTTGHGMACPSGCLYVCVYQILASHSTFTFFYIDYKQISYLHVFTFMHIELSLFTFAPHRSWHAPLAAYSLHRTYTSSPLFHPLLHTLALHSIAHTHIHYRSWHAPLAA